MGLRLRSVLLIMDDLLTAAQKRTRTGRSFFPAANGSYRGINYTLGGQPSTNAINSTPQGQTLGVPDSRYGFRALPPEQNPAYQAAISRPRLQRGDLTTIRTPSGGFVTVPSSSAGAAAQAVPGSTVTQIGNQFPIDRAAAYAKGYGAPNPVIQGGYQIAGGVANPIENLTPAARAAGGVGSTLDYFKANPALNVAVNALGGFGRNIASWFGGGQQAAQQYGNNVSTGTPIPFQTNNQPRRYSDYY